MVLYQKFNSRFKSRIIGKAIWIACPMLSLREIKIKSGQHEIDGEK